MGNLPCSVKGVFVAPGPTGAVPVVLLTAGTDRFIPIFIGFSEAFSIKSACDGVVLPRPFTHDLFIETFARFDIHLHSLQIDTITEGVFYAQLVLADKGRQVKIDCRPSDGIALALRCNAPIFIENEVVESAGQDSKDLPRLVELETYLHPR